MPGDGVNGSDSGNRKKLRSQNSNFILHAKEKKKTWGEKEDSWGGGWGWGGGNADPIKQPTRERQLLSM